MNPTLTYRPKSPSTNIGGYRYFFNGQEGDNEVFEEVANFGYEFRQYDSRLGRWWSVDPKWNEYPICTHYMHKFCQGGSRKSSEEWAFNPGDYVITEPHTYSDGTKYPLVVRVTESL